MKKIILTTAILASLAIGFVGTATAQADTLTDIANTEDVQKTLQEQTDKADISGITDATSVEEQANNIVDAFSTSDLEAQTDGIFSFATKVNEHTSALMQYQKESNSKNPLNYISVMISGNADKQLEKEAITKDMESIQKFNYNFSEFENENTKIANILKNGAVSVICLTALALLVKAIPMINLMFFGSGEFSKKQNDMFKTKAKEDAVKGFGLTLDDIIWLISLPFKLIILPFKLAFYTIKFMILVTKTTFKIIKIQYSWLYQLFLVIKSKPVYNFKKIK
ncbi:hypothetical protein [Enterococcus gallinarum]|uniref:hypothetical protein n=1 Tax=Enterococcus gallinarum TaxID=1353 RepID=UPI001CAA6EDC|nr:hypothetical protein [Enterococcus gallinarum]